MRFRRQISTTPLCAICGRDEESWWHALFPCNWAANVWCNLGADPVTLAQGHTRIDDSCPENFFKGWSARSLATIWIICVERNTRYFNGCSKPLHILKKKAIDLGSCFTRIFSHGIKHRETRYVNWNAGSSREVLLHIDGSSRGNPGAAGFGIVLRSNDGTWIKGYSGSIGVATNLEAELHAILNGIPCLKEHNLNRSATCFSDSFETVRLVSRGDNGRQVYGTLLLAIAEEVRQMRNLEILNILREGNMVADYLAKCGSNSEEFFTTCVFPPDNVKETLVSDASGVHYLDFSFACTKKTHNTL